ncbi:cytochrome P450 [Durotheca rogersii]|uniref:cytochrome P450 n=1 Tax=Durotheca rogersii TaxID=419775 RepID=UPI00221F453B|nr:cytochrome P450 [Durotheca rogersii]KAI5862561.1 cytochrome P450 [Durotheca rogersii]
MLRFPGPSGAYDLSVLLKAVGYLTLIGLARFLYLLYQNRMLFRRVQKDYGIAMLPHSLLFGHLPVIAKVAMKYKMPRDAHGHWMILYLKREYPEITNKGIIYMDVWPVGYPMVAVYDPDMMAQFTQEHSLPKFWAMGQVEFKPFTNGEDLVTLEGPEWKAARSLFNPGFSMKNLLSLVPDMIEETLVFRERLRKAAESGEIVKLEEYTTDVTVDVIGRTVLGTRLETQKKPNLLMRTMRSQLALLYFELNFAKLLNPLRPLRHWLYNRTIRREIMPYILDTARNYERIEGPKTIIALALKTFAAEKGAVATGRGGLSRSDVDNIPAAFLERIVKHIKIFMFAGHDTTATALAYAYALLGQHPDKLAALRAEHNAVLGPDPRDAADRLRADPALLGKLPYTLAVLRETLRLFPPVGGSIRQAPPGHLLVDPVTGVPTYPTHGFMLHSSAATTQRDPDRWPDADTFVPERFLPATAGAGKEGGGDNPLRVPRGAWRPFEMGPRNCIGQELVSVEVRLILALTAREFAVEQAYPAGAPVWMGTPAYQVSDPELVATAHIKDGLPVRVKASGR